MLTMKSTSDVEDILLPKVEQHELTLLYEYLNSDTVDKEAVAELVGRNPSILTEKYKEHGDKNILQVACSILAKNLCKVENINVLSTLIDQQSLFYANAKENGNEAIHYACLTRKPEILTLIVDAIVKYSKSRINARTCDGETALHLLLSKKSPIDSFECIQILIKNRIDVNISDNNNATPLLHALKKLDNYVHGKENKSQEIEVTKKIVSLLIDEGSFLHSHKLNKKTPKNYIEDLGLDIPVERTDPEQEEKNTIFGYLKENNEGMLLNCRNIATYSRSDDGNVTLLQLACKKGYFRAVKLLLDNKANVSIRTAKNDYPIVIAARSGRFDIFEVLLKHHHNKHAFLGLAILELTKRLYEKNTKMVNHEKCLDMLLQRKYVNVNDCDEDGITPLHCAAKLRKTAVCLNLLQRGALLSTRDNDGNTPIKYLDYSTLKKHFDYCIYYSTTDHFHNPWTSREDREVGKTIKLDYTSILPKISEDTTKSVHMGVLYEMSEKSELKNIFDHPLVTSFLDFKFLNIVKLYHFNLWACILYCILLYLQIFLVYIYDSHVLIKIALYFFWFILLTAFVSRTMFQLWSQFNSYVKNPDNIVELILFVMTLLILFGCPSKYDLKRQIAAFAIVLAAYELLIYMGQLPTFSTNVKMLKKVTRNFVKFMLWYCCLIMGFVLSFYILFCNDYDRDSARNKTLPSNLTNSEGVNFFGSFWFTIVKGIVMLTGEFDAASMPLELYPITGVLIFMMFVVMISIVVFNLLNGLAVDDIQEIRRNAVILDNISRAMQMSTMESSFLKLSNVEFKMNVVNKIKNTLSDWIYSNAIFKNGEVEITVEGNFHRNEDYKDNGIYLNRATLNKIRELIDMEKVEERYMWHMKNVRREQLFEQHRVLLDAKQEETSKLLNEILAALKNDDAPEVSDQNKQRRNYRARK